MFVWLRFGLAEPIPLPHPTPPHRLPPSDFPPARTILRVFTGGGSTPVLPDSSSVFLQGEGVPLTIWSTRVPSSEDLQGEGDPWPLLGLPVLHVRVLYQGDV